MRSRLSSKSLVAEATAQHLEPARPPWIRIMLARFDLRVLRVQHWLIGGGLLGLVVVGLISIPGDRVFDVNLRPYQLVGMLFSHASVLALLIGVSPWRSNLLRWAQRATPSTLIGWSILVSGALLEAWLTLFPLSPDYMSSLARESGLLEPVQAAFYVTASWLAWQCGRWTPRLDERRLFRAAAVVCAFMALEEVEYFGVFELTAGGRTHGVWVRAMHDFIEPGVRVSAARSVLITLAVAAAGLVLWYVGLRCVLRQATSPAAVPAVLAVGVLAFSQILDQDNAALMGYSRLFSYRIEEPLELIAALLMNVALAIKYGEAGRLPGQPESAGI